MVKTDQEAKEVQEMGNWPNAEDFKKSLEGLHPLLQKAVINRTKKTTPERAIFPNKHSAK